MENVYSYVRVSTNLQVEGSSLEFQQKDIQEFAKKNNLNIVGEYVDGGRSGQNIKDRPDFQRMLDDIESCKDKVSYVVVFKLSRFGRNAFDIYSTLQKLEAYDVGLISTQESINSKAIGGKLLINIMASISEIEKENIKLFTTTGRYERASQGFWNGGIAPYGYKIEDKKLVIEEEEAVLIRKIFELYVEKNMGHEAIANFLNNHGFKKNVRGNHKDSYIRRSFVKGVLANEVYFGAIRYGKRKKVKKKGSNEDYKQVIQSEFEVHENTHEAIISKEMWELAKEKREKKSYIRKKKHDVEHVHLLTGLLKCPKCHCGMYSNPFRKRVKNKLGTEVVYSNHYYACKHRQPMENGQRCNFKKHFPQKKVNEELINILNELFKVGKMPLEIESKIGNNFDLSALNEERDNLLKGVASNERKLEKAYRSLFQLNEEDKNYVIQKKAIDKNIRDYSDEISTLNNELSEVSNKITLTKKNTLTRDSFYEHLRMFKKIINESPDTDKKTLLNNLIEKIEIYEEERPDKRIIKSISLRFALNVDGIPRKEFFLDKKSHDETIVLMSRV